jgi:ribosomal protein S18 acetylase RimI-like enzyme
MPPTIRPATADDLDTVVLMWRAFMKDQHRFARRWRLTKDNAAFARDHFAELLPHGQVFVADDSGELVGFSVVVVDLPPMDTYYASASISDVYVAPASRGQGLGRALVQAAIAKIRDAGLHGVSLNVASGNEAARRLYRSLGFRPMQETLILPLDPDYVKFGPQARED